jgi:hypothetical protein
LTLSLARSTRDVAALHVGSVALVAGILSNTVLKLLLVLVVGRGWFRTVTTAGLGVIALALSAALWVAR